MRDLYRFIVFIFLVIAVFFIFRFQVRASRNSGECYGQCGWPSGSRHANTAVCGDCCLDEGPQCTAGCNANTHVCAWDGHDATSNHCTNWCPFCDGACENGLCDNLCCDGFNTSDLRVIACGQGCNQTSDCSDPSTQQCCNGECIPFDASCFTITGCADATNVALTREDTSNIWQLTWDDGGSSGKYTNMVFIDQDSSKVNCGSPSCYDANTSEYKLEIPPYSGNPPNRGPIYIYDLTPNAVYYIHIAGYKSDSNKCGSTTPAVTSCGLTPNPLYIPVVGGTADLKSVTANYDGSSGVKRVKFKLNADTYASFPYGSDTIHYSDERTSPPQTFKVTVKGLAGNGVNSVTVKGDVYFEGDNTTVQCTDTASVLVNQVPTITQIPSATPTPTIPPRPPCAYGPELATNPDLTNNFAGWGFWSFGNTSYSYEDGAFKFATTGNGSAGIGQEYSGSVANKYYYVKALLKRLAGETSTSPYTAIGQYHSSTGSWEYNIPSGNGIYYPVGNDWEIIGNSTPALIAADVTKINYGADIWEASAGNYYVGWISLCEAPGPTPTNTPVPTATPLPGPWIKLKDSSFYSGNDLRSIIPASPDLYPDGTGDDTGEPFFIIGNGGLVAAPHIDLGPGKANAREQSVSYSPNSPFYTPNTFLSYVKTRKEYTPINDHDLTHINSDGIYVYQGSLTLNNIELNKITASKSVLIVDGDINIDEPKFNTSDCSTVSKTIAILSKTGKITFSNATQCAAGIFIADEIDVGDATDQSLKIIGNLIAQSTLTNVNVRHGANLNAPSLFIVFKPQPYLDLLPYLSIASYEWRQIQ